MKNNIIGIMGGTFNPIHLGHIELAIAAHHQFDIPKILVMPCADPSSYKDTTNLVSAKNRSEMVKLAIKDYPFLTFSDLEIKRIGKTYTADTLRLLKPEYDTIFFIIGADSLFNLEKWYMPEYVCANCHLLVANRDNESIDKINNMIKHLKNKYNANIDIINIPNQPFSSTQIREAIACGKDVSKMLNLDVYKYIQDNCIYSNISVK